MNRYNLRSAINSALKIVLTVAAIGLFAGAPNSESSAANAPQSYWSCRGCTEHNYGFYTEHAFHAYLPFPDGDNYIGEDLHTNYVGDAHCYDSCPEAKRLHDACPYECCETNLLDEFFTADDPMTLLKTFPREVEYNHTRRAVQIFAKGCGVIASRPVGTH